MTLLIQQITRKEFDYVTPKEMGVESIEEIIAPQDYKDGLPKSVADMFGAVKGMANIAICVTPEGRRFPALTPIS